MGHGAVDDHLVALAALKPAAGCAASRADLEVEVEEFLRVRLRRDEEEQARDDTKKWPHIVP